MIYCGVCMCVLGSCEGCDFQRNPEIVQAKGRTCQRLGISAPSNKKNPKTI